MKRGQIINFFTDDEAIKHLNSIGLKEITSEKQQKNGTRCFLDTAMVSADNKLATMYTFHKNGYIRLVKYSGWQNSRCRWHTELINRRTTDKKNSRRIRVLVPQFSAQVGCAVSTIFQHRKNNPNFA
jgi:hypothetical protein